MEQAKNWEDVKPITDVNWSGCLLSSNLKRYKLGDIAEIIISSVDKKTKDGEQKVRLCNFVDVYHNWAITKSMHNSFMIASAKEKDIERLSLKKGYVALTKDSETRDDIGISTYIADNLNNVILGYHCALVKPNEDILSGKYLNAFLHSNYIKKYFELNATGSGMRYTLSIQTLYDMPILLPSLEEQEYIGDIFSTIDKKIELNRSINHNLESMAKQLYDYWFVQFDFPDENGKPYKSSGGKMVWNEKLKREIPEGWNIVFAKDVCPIITGKEDANFSTTHGQYPFFTCAKENLFCDTYAFDESSILIAGNGDFNVKHYTGKFNAYQRTYVLTPNPEYYACLFFAANSKIGQFKDNSNGSIIKFITKGDVENIELYKSENKYLYNTLNSLLFSIEQNNQEISSLTKLRDEMAPLLMNGQVKVGIERSRLNYDLPLHLLFLSSVPFSLSVLFCLCVRSNQKGKE